MTYRPERRRSALFCGLATLDVVHHVDSRPGPDEKVTAVRQFVAAGGPAANAAVTFAALGGRSRLVTAVGTGPVGTLIAAELTQRGVEVVDTAPADYDPPVSAITVRRSTGQRSVTSADARGSLARVDPAVVEGAGTVLVDGHHAGLATVVARAAADHRIPLVLDAGRWKPVMADLLPLCTAVVAGPDFRLPEFGGADGDPTGDRSAAELAARGVPLVATTHGPEPVRWWWRGRSGTVPVRPVEDPDTLGAGDALHGAFVFATMGDGDPLASLRFAVGVAALKCATPGPRGWLEHLPPPA